MSLKSSALARQEQHVVEGESLQPGDEQQMVEAGHRDTYERHGSSTAREKASGWAFGSLIITKEAINRWSTQQLLSSR